MKYTLTILLALCFGLGHVHAQYDEDESMVAYGPGDWDIGHQTEVGYLFKTEKGEQNRGLSIRQSAWLNIKGPLAVGLGLGYDQYDTQNILPAFVQVKADLVQNEKYSPFLCVQGGLGISLTADEENELLNESFEYDGGTYYQLGGGLLIRSEENISWTISLAYINQSHSRIRNYTEVGTNGALSIEENYVDNRVALRIGFLF